MDTHKPFLLVDVVSCETSFIFFIPRFIKRSVVYAGSGPVSEKQHAARCAVLLQDWLQELAALAQEQTVAVPSLEFKFPSS